MKKNIRRRNYFLKVIIFLSIPLLIGIVAGLISNQSRTNKSLAMVLASTTSCTPQSPEVVLVSSSVPGAMSLGQKAQVSYTIMNCSTSTWTKGIYTLGSQSPQDNLKWGIGRVQLPRNVAPSETVTLDFEVVAPSKAGAYTMQWGILSQTAWYKPYLPPAIVIVGPTKECNELAKFKNSGLDATSTLQTCIDSTIEGENLELLAGVYKISRPIRITKPITIVTKELKSAQIRCLEHANTPCATLRATPDFPSNSPIAGPENNALLVFPPKSDGSYISGVTLKNIVIDGDRYNRTKLNTLCKSANESSFNIFARLNNSNFFYLASIKAGCGSALQAIGDNNIFAHNYIAENGTHLLAGLWADGMSVQGNKLTIMNNVFRNNTDVDLIVWGSSKSDIYFNNVIHDNANYFAYATIMLNTYGASPWREALADFTDTQLSYNTITCNGYCGIGIQLGEKNWVSNTVNNIGGTVSKNIISGALQGINKDKSGRTNSPTRVFGNIFSDPRRVTVQKAGRTITTSNLNEAPGSVVLYDLGQRADTRQSLAPETSPMEYLLSCNNYPTLCRNQAPENTTFTGNVFCQGTDGKVYPMPNVEIRVYGSGNQKELLTRTNEQGNFSTSFVMPYQSYQISAKLPSETRVVATNGKKYSELKYSGGYCSSWMSGCVNSSCGANGTYEGCILEPGKTNGPFVFAYSNCTN